MCVLMWDVSNLKGSFMHVIIIILLPQSVFSLCEVTSWVVSSRVLGIGKIVLICSICQFPCFLYAQLGWFQDSKVKSLNKDLGRNAHHQLCQQCESGPAQGFREKARKGLWSKQLLSLNLERWGGIFWVDTDKGEGGKRQDCLAKGGQLSLHTKCVRVHLCVWWHLCGRDRLGKRLPPASHLWL